MGCDAAIQSTSGDAAAVFFFTPGGKVSIVPCVSVGTLEDEVWVGSPDGNVTQTTRRVQREVFVPLPTQSPVQLPKFWSIRGFAPANTVSSTTDPNDSSATGWYDSVSENGAANDPAGGRHWVFPETGFVDLTATSAGTRGWQRQTFMVRFKAGTGALDSGNLSTALVFDPVSVAYGTGFRATGSDPWGLDRALPENRGYLASEASDQARFVARLLSRNPANEAERRRRLRVLGDQSVDSVLARPVTELAVYNERSLAAGLSQSIRCRGLNRTTNTLYAEPGTYGPRVDVNLFAGSPTISTINEVIGKWIEGRATVNNTNATGTNGIESDARIFTLQHYLGQVQELVQ